MGLLNNFEIDLCENTMSGPQQNGFVSMGYINSLSLRAFYLCFPFFHLSNGTIAYCGVGLGARESASDGGRAHRITSAQLVVISESTTRVPSLN